jgi:XXXCH domain-containing protein
MKDFERKIKMNIPFAEVPTHLRHLADAVEGQTGGLPSEWADLPDPIAKLEVKGRARGGTWDFKIKIKAEPIASPGSQQTAMPETAHATPSLASGRNIDYTQVKKRMKAAFKSIGESLAVQKLPEKALLEAFMTASNQMMTFTGAAYGEAHYPDFRKACRALRASYETPDLEAFKTAYAALAQLKKDCHKACK